MVVLDPLFLLDRVTASNLSVPPEKQPLAESIERLNFVGGGCNFPPEGLVRDVLQQKNGTDHPSQFTEGAIEPVLEFWEQKDENVR